MWVDAVHEQFGPCTVTPHPDERDLMVVLVESFGEDGRAFVCHLDNLLSVDA